MPKRRAKTEVEQHNLMQELDGIDEQQALAIKSSEFLRMLDGSTETAVNSKLTRDKAKAAFNRHVAAIEGAGYWIVKLTADGVKRLTKCKTSRYVNPSDLDEYDCNLCVAYSQPIYGYLIGKGESLPLFAETCKELERRDRGWRHATSKATRRKNAGILPKLPDLMQKSQKLLEN